MDYTQMIYIWRPAANKNAHTLLLLHGTGGDENDLIPLAAEFGSGFNILSLRGNVSEHGMPRFFKRLGMGIFDEKDLHSRTDEMVSFIKSLADKEDFDVTKIIALGYSNGANIAGSTLILYPTFLSGAILYRPMQPFKEISNDLKNDGQTPVFMSNGTDDPTIDRAATASFVKLLKNAGFDVESHELQTGHQLSQKDVQLSVDWYKRKFK